MRNGDDLDPANAATQADTAITAAGDRLQHHAVAAKLA